jgi:hypothetical protein
LNPGRRGGKPATNRFSYGAAIFVGFITLMITGDKYIEQQGD